MFHILQLPFLVDKIKSSLCLCFCCIFFCLTSCEYQTNQVYYNHVSKDVADPDITIGLNLDWDTIYVYTNLQQPYIRVKVHVENKFLYAVKLFADEVELQGSVTGPEEYSFSLDLGSRSMVHVKAQIYTSTGTGSIADGLQAEAFIIETRECVLIKCTDIPVITSSIDNGRLKLSWTPAKSTSPVKYYIYSSNKRDSTYNAWYVDSSYTGGTNYIYLYNEQQEISGYRASLEINYPYPKASVSNTDSFLVKWDKSLFYKNIGGYRLNMYDTIIDVEDPGKTTYVIKNGVFRKFYFISIGFLPEKGKSRDVPYVCSAEGGYQLNLFPDFTAKYFPLKGNYMYCWSYQNPYLRKYSLATKKELSYKTSIPGINHLAISANNKYILYDDNSYLNLIDVSNMNVIRSVSSANIIGSSPFFNLVVSDNAESVFYDYAKQSLVIYDFLNQKIKVEIPVNGYVSSMLISPDGSYVFLPWENTLYKINADSYEIIPRNSSKITCSYCEFMPNSSQMFIYDGKTSYVINCSDFSIDRSFTFNDAHVINIDYLHDRVCSYKDRFIYIYSLSDGSLFRRIPGDYTPDTRLFNDYLIDNFQLNINNP